MTKARKLADLIDANGDVTVANLDNVTADAISSGTLSSDRLPTVPVSKGGTGTTSLGSAGQYIKVNSGATGLEYGTVPNPDWNTLANKPSTIIQGATYGNGAIGNTLAGTKYNSFSHYVSGTNIHMTANCNCNCDCNG